MSDQILVSTLPFLSKAIERKVGFRLILPQDISPPESVRQLVDNPVFEQGARKGLLQSRFIEKVDVFICMSEKEVTALSFTNPDGKLDYIGFKANDERAYKWVKNLYSYYWSITSTKIPDKLLTDQKRRY